MLPRTALIRKTLMSAMADDYENLEHLTECVSKSLVKHKIAPLREELLQMLEELTREGLAQAYRLSPNPPYSTPVSFTVAASSQLWFYLTPDGLSLLRRE